MISQAKLSITLDLGLTRRTAPTRPMSCVTSFSTILTFAGSSLTLRSRRIGRWPIPLSTPWREQVLLARHSNVWLDLSALPHHLPEGDYPFSGIDIFVRKAVDLVGADRLLWGTDAPGMLWMLTYQQMLDVVRLHCHSLTAEQRRLILGENALRAMLW